MHTSGYTVLEQFAGRVVAKRSSELGFERSGTVLRVFFDEGDRVEAGEVLVLNENFCVRISEIVDLIEAEA